jgi:lipopolysaccharide heptosyltransferase II
VIPKKILLIQTAFIGDVILSTSLVETLHLYGVERIDVLVRKGNETLLKNNSKIHMVWIWNKKEAKVKNLWALLLQIRKEKYDEVYNLQRFGLTGFLTVFSKAKVKSGFRKNPFSFLYTHAHEHELTSSGTMHEIERNHKLLSHLDKLPEKAAKPKLYPSMDDINFVKPWVQEKFLVFAPASVWYTKRFPIEQWIKLTKQCPKNLNIIFLGGPDDKNLSDEIIRKSCRENCINLCGELNFLQSAALMAQAQRNIVNDSGPLHIASAMNAPTTALFCSTVAEFGFGPLSDDAVVVQAKKKLSCRPCGNHGLKACPEGHFECGYLIDIKEIIDSFGGKNHKAY